MYSKFPKEMAYPERKGKYRIVKSKEEFIRAVNLYNKKASVYTTIYSFVTTKFNKYMQQIPDYDTMIIDKVYFDLDSDKSLENAIILHKYFLKNDWQHYIIFSGNGFHLFVLTEEIMDEKIEVKKELLEKFTVQIAEFLGLSIGDSSYSDIDEKIVGDTSRVSRVLYTKNIKQHVNRWCIPISSEVLCNSSLDEIKIRASGDILKREPLIIYGKQKIDLYKWDDYEIPKKYRKEKIAMTDEVADIEDFGTENMWSCIRKMLIERSGCKAWYWSIVWLKEKGYSYSEIDAILKKYLSQYKRTDGTYNDYWHCINSDKHLEMVFSKGKKKHWFPCCETIRDAGFCEKKCQHYKEIYY